jgi:hypothetical protein
MQGVLNLDPSCLVFFFFGFLFGSFWKSELGFPRLALRTRLFIFDSILFGSDDGKLNRVSRLANTFGKGFDFARSGNIWGFTFNQLW